mmetsp:Transcript_80959/g.229918  ORF Transcript_80959/g.229918 Transcript_80959/m.229918 type:complete len:287 (-) Transcript_80959:476-1336(-)
MASSGGATVEATPSCHMPLPRLASNSSFVCSYISFDRSASVGAGSSPITSTPSSEARLCAGRPVPDTVSLSSPLPSPPEWLCLCATSFACSTLPKKLARRFCCRPRSLMSFPPPFSLPRDLDTTVPRDTTDALLLDPLLPTDMSPPPVPPEPSEPASPMWVDRRSACGVCGTAGSAAAPPPALPPPPPLPPTPSNEVRVASASALASFVFTGECVWVYDGSSYSCTFSCRVFSLNVIVAPFSTASSLSGNLGGESSVAPGTSTVAVAATLPAVLSSSCSSSLSAPL